ncbi:hypothetical protein [Catalinimonas alkaloidigena]|nr:hypothetical protein [Catalinimonas alkaloidigena]
MAVRFQTAEYIPPPYSHVYTLEAVPRPDGLAVRYELTYLDREDLTEEEIYDEGFTPDDDFVWEGVLSSAWTKALRDLLRKGGSTDMKESDGEIHLTLTDAQGQVAEGTPRKRETWAYFCQELVQAIYEVSGKERALVVRFAKVDPEQRVQLVTVQPSFRERRVQVRVETPPEERTFPLAWPRLKPLLRSVYAPDYEMDKSFEATPNRPGHYLDPGEGVWYRFGSGVLNPGPDQEVLQALEQWLNELLEKPGAS